MKGCEPGTRLEHGKVLALLHLDGDGTHQMMWMVNLRRRNELLNITTESITQLHTPTEERREQE
jgi:hypothetical protein